MVDPGFRPPLLLRSRHLQSALASLQPRRGVVLRQTRAFEQESEECVLECGDGVRLQGFFTPSNRNEVKGLAIFLHGWEGSAQSTYVLSAAHFARRRGHDVFRLNFRDHGESHHLNEGIFHSCRLAEVVDAIEVVSRRFPSRPLCLVGFSLGGNFALRVALQAPERGIPLERVISINPPIDPASVLDRLENGFPPYEGFFVRKWRRSLRRKQELFPELYDLVECTRLSGLREMTRYLIERYSDMGTLERYLDGYSIAGDRLIGLHIPATVITAEDDPIIPIQDFHDLARPESLTLEIQPRGGHCGYIGSISRPSWIDQRIVTLLDGGRPLDGSPAC